jgi:hypothetical protein
MGHSTTRACALRETKPKMMTPTFVQDCYARGTRAASWMQRTLVQWKDFTLAGKYVDPQQVVDRYDQTIERLRAERDLIKAEIKKLTA